MTAEQRHRVVIVGGGFGGLNCALSLRKADCDVTLIDRRNFHLFQPLLYQVATGGLSPANIATPLRAAVKWHKHTRVVLGDVTGIDVAAREVELSSGNRIPYDTLVVAAGSVTGYFAHPEWAEHAPGLKTVEEATEIRRRILLAFEAAELSDDPAVIDRCMTFVLIGGGPTGVEMSGAISELARHTLANDFRTIAPKKTRVVLVEGNDRLLKAFHPELSAYALKTLTNKMNVEVWLTSRVKEVHTDHIMVDRGGGSLERLNCETVDLVGRREGVAPGEDARRRHRRGSRSRRPRLRGARPDTRWSPGNLRHR